MRGKFLQNTAPQSVLFGENRTLRNGIAISAIHPFFVTFRGKKSIARAGDTVNVPSNAPHQFHNSSSKDVRLLCICSPAGLDNFFQELGVPVATRTAAPAELDKEQQREFIEKAKALAPKYRTELLKEA